MSLKPLSPAVAYLVNVHKIAPGQLVRIPASGPQGRLLKGDILKFVSGGIAAPQPVSLPQESLLRNEDRVEPSQIAVGPDMRVMAEGWQASKQRIPHSYVRGECSISELRTALLGMDVDEKLGMDSAILKAFADAMIRQEVVDGEVHIQVEAASAPTVQDVGTCGIQEIVSQLQQPGESVPAIAAFTSVEEATPVGIIPRGLSFALAVGGVTRAVQVKQGRLAVDHRVQLSLSHNPSQIDEARAIDILSHLCKRLESPGALLL